MENAMLKRKVSVILAILLILALSPETILAEDIQSCGDSATKTGKTYKVNGSGHLVRTGPGADFDKIVNQKATRILKKTQYKTIDKSVTVYEECSQDGWSKIRVTDPEWLRQSRHGWVESKVLRGKKIDSSGTEVFTEADFHFDSKTLPYKNIIIAGVNKVYRENSRCKKIDPYSANISSTKGTPSNPVFFVTCGTGANVFNAFFSKSEVEEGVSLSAKKHIDQTVAIKQCENYAKSKAAHPSTVNFSNLLDLAVTEFPNGRTTVISSFTAKNSFNLELKYRISCWFEASGLIEANIIETN